MSSVQSLDARSGEILAEVALEATADDVEHACAAAAAVAPAWAGLSRTARATVLRSMAAALTADAAELVAVADRETALGEPRLRGEIDRAAYQLRFFADVIEDGGYLEAIIDHAGDTPLGRRPDVRRMLVPIGPVAVFGASNFPFAFSVPGGDTASALAAGCPVVVKGHPSHPATSIRCHEALADGAAAAGAPAGLVQLIHGQLGGVLLVQHPEIRAVGFTGSTAAGRVLHDHASARPDPVPFYGELGSVNPVVLAPGACAERGEQIATGLVASVTLGSGQFCTKPGLIFLPSGADGDRVRDAVVRELGEAPAATLLNRGIRQAYVDGAARLAAHAAVRRLVEPSREDLGSLVEATLVEVSAGDLDAELVEECFGPFAVVVRYNGADDLRDAVRRVPSSLTATVHASAADDEFVIPLEQQLRGKAGRLVWNGFPTGVAVTWAMHHGGPWPATTSIHTSVGATAIRRFLRPVAWQDVPQALLPDELRDDAPGFPLTPVRVDGTLRHPG